MLRTAREYLKSLLPFTSFTKKDPALSAVLALAARHDYERTHSHRVANFALSLFDDLQPIHRLDSQARFWLKCAAILHDIAKSSGKAHHKEVLRIVLRSSDLPFNVETRRIIGLVARYHRKSAPGLKHRHFAVLTRSQREVVTQLAAILRFADALDSGHQGLVKTLRCDIESNQIIGRCATTRGGKKRRTIERKARQKGVLLEKVFGRKLTIDWCKG